MEKIDLTLEKTKLKVLVRQTLTSLKLRGIVKRVLYKHDQVLARLPGITKSLPPQCAPGLRQKKKKELKNN